VISRDAELLRNSIVDNGKVNIFNGEYDDYRQTIIRVRRNIENELEFLVKEKKENHKALMKEQQRAKKAKKDAENLLSGKKWLPVLGDLN
jgi:peptidoglycan hydrolase CwlO-like protein